MQLLDTITIRHADADDEAALERLAALDSAERPTGWMLIAEVAGEPWAAVEVRSGETIADPFHPTADLIALLALRAARLRGTTKEPRGVRRVLSLRRVRSRHAFAAQR